LRKGNKREDFKNAARLMRKGKKKKGREGGKVSARKTIWSVILLSGPGRGENGKKEGGDCAEEMSHYQGDNKDN